VTGSIVDLERAFIELMDNYRSVQELKPKDPLRRAIDGVIDQFTIFASPNGQKITDRSRAIDGASFIDSVPDNIPAIWGAGDQILWAEGEPLLLVGPDGVGKTTLGQELALCRVGVRDKLLGFPVAPAVGSVLYIAADRPRQAASSMRRMVAPTDADVLRERLVVWRGPLPFQLTKEPTGLAALAAQNNCTDVIIDSLKDIAAELTKDEVGSWVNIAFQETIANDIQLVVLHHQRKQSNGGTKPRALADVYGSRWLTAGMGSVLLLWGEPGDLVVELRHLKQPAEDIGPLTVIHDHARGSSSLEEPVDLIDLVSRANDGLTVHNAAVNLFTSATPGRNEIEKARRRLESLVTRGEIVRQDVNGVVHYFDRLRVR
jgi:replicative DNA helicase